MDPWSITGFFATYDVGQEKQLTTPVTSQIISSTFQIMLFDLILLEVSE